MESRRLADHEITGFSANVKRHRSKLLREHENTITMLCAIVAVADEHAWRVLVFTGGGSHATYLGRITARAIATNNTGGPATTP